MDYKALLILYMNHIIDEESICYIEHLTPEASSGSHQWPYGATKEDVAELINIRDEVLAKHKAEYEAWRQNLDNKGIKV